MLNIFLPVFFAVHYGLFHFVYFSFLRHSLKDLDAKPIVFAAAIFFLNHLFSFFYNYKKDDARDIVKLMALPYSRIIPMHMTIIFGGFLMAVIKQDFAQTIVLIFFLMLKTYIDVKMHLSEHFPVPVKNKFGIIAM